MSDRLHQDDAALSAIVAWERRLDAEEAPNFSACLRHYPGDPDALIPELVAHYRLHWNGEDDAWIDELVEANPAWERAIREAAFLPDCCDLGDWPPQRAADDDRIGPYRLLERLASGGFADVYRAASSEGGRVVVLKALRRGDHHPGDTLAALTHERRTLKQLPSHPGLVRYEDWEPDPRRPAIVTSYIDGRTIGALRERRQPTEDQAVRLMLELAEAVEAAHTAGVYHRDLKPENVLVRREGGAPVVVDFGLAELRDDHSGAVTSAERLGGTPEYAPPEVYDPEAYGWPDGKRMDVYGLGAILYYLLAGYGPTAAETPQETSRRARACAIDWGRLDATPYSQPLKRVCRQALDRDPTRRFENVSQLKRALSQSPAGRRLALSQRARRWGPKALLAAACLALTAYSVYQTVGFDRMSRLLERRTPPPANAWVGELAQERGIELSSVRADDFRVLAGCVERTPKVSSVERPPTGAAGLLAIVPDERLRPLIDSLLYRVGPTRWRPFPLRGDRGEPFAYLTGEEVDAGLAVQLRIDAPGEGVVGPFDYPLPLREAIARDSVVVRRERIAEASQTQWLVDSPVGWRVDRAFLERFGDLVTAFHLTDAGEDMTSLIAVTPPDNETPSAFDGRFTRETSALDQTHAVRISLAFRDGSASEPSLVRRQNAYGHDGTDASALKVLSEVPPELPMACLRVGNFNLAGLALADLALHSVEIGPTAGEPQVVLPVRWTPTAANGGAKTPATLTQEARKRNKLFASERHLNPAPCLTVYNGQCGGASLPPVWRSVYIRGRLKGGGVTPIYRIDNEFPLPGYELPVIDASSGAPPIQTYLYGYAPTRAPEGIGGYRPQTVWQPDAWLYSVAPEGTRVEYYADERFRTRLHDINPGLVYARVSTDGGTVGGYELRIDEATLKAVLAKAAELPSAVEQEPAPSGELHATAPRSARPLTPVGRG